MKKTTKNNFIEKPGGLCEQQRPFTRNFIESVYDIICTTIEVPWPDHLKETNRIRFQNKDGFIFRISDILFTQNGVNRKSSSIYQKKTIRIFFFYEDSDKTYKVHSILDYELEKEEYELIYEK